MDINQLSVQLKSQAERLGFARAGICPAVTPAGLSRFHEWLQAGYGGEMHYLAERRDAYAHPTHVLEGARSILLLALNYRTSDPTATQSGEGRVSRYAWGSVDYHDLIHPRLRQLAAWLRDQVPGAHVRGVVDTAPLLEREFAQLAGLGWVGKNTLLLSRSLGSWFFLAALLTDLTLDYDEPYEADHCGTCRACLDACPTDAFPRPYVLDATRCISYLTIELRSAVPGEMREGLGDWLFVCDICQHVLPWNSRAPKASEPGFRPQADADPVELGRLFDLDDAAFRARFRRTPLWRAKRRGILRNAAIVLGNQRASSAIEALRRGVDDEDPMVQEACTWALKRIHSE